MKQSNRQQPKSTRTGLPSPKPETTASFLNFVVLETDTLHTALLAIERNVHRTVVVTNNDNIVVGVLSDGDARMSLIDGRLLSTPVHRIMNADFIAVSPKEHAKAKEILAQGHIFVIPVVNSKGTLLEILTNT